MKPSKVKRQTDIRHTHKGITEYGLLPGLSHTNVMEKERDDCSGGVSSINALLE